MPTVRERFMSRASSVLSDWTGLAVTEAEQLDTLRERSEAYGELSHFSEDLADRTLDFIGGHAPREADVWHRRILSRRSRTALVHDPIAGAEANLRANFAFGKGISKPQATDEQVQTIIDRAWEDPVNEKKLTSYQAQRKRSNDLITSANLFPGFVEHNGRIRVVMLEPDEVTDIVADPDDDEVPLYYVTRKRKQEWDFDQDAPKPVLGYEMEGGREVVFYFPHWRFVEEAVKWAEETGDSPPPMPPAYKRGHAWVEHVAINQIGRTQFGIPPWARTLRFYSAMNQLTEAQVAMRQGAASIIAQRIRRGGPKDVQRAAAGVLNMVGEFGASRFGRRAEGDEPRNAGPGTEPQVGKAPPPAASWLTSNEGERLEAVNLSSGASQAAQDAQIVRAPLAAASGFGQHYLGDPSSTTLAGGTTLELPTLMEVSAWQETFEGLYRYFTDRSIEAAVRAGQLGGMIGVEKGDGRSLQDLRLPEDRVEMEKRLGLDLSYSFEMPYPGRRNLPDVVNAVTAIATGFDPMGVDRALRRNLLDFFARHGLLSEDPAKWVEEALPEEGELPPFPGTGLGPGEGEEEGGGEEGGAGSASAPSKNGREASEQPQYKGQKTRSRPPSNEMGGGTRTREVMEAALAEGTTPDPAEFIDAMNADAAREFAALAADPMAILSGKAPSTDPAKARNGANGNLG
jgi:hypothetical protein